MQNANTLNSDYLTVTAVLVCEERIGECFMQAGSVDRAIFSRDKARLSIGLVALGLWPRRMAVRLDSYRERLYGGYQHHWRQQHVWDHPHDSKK